MKKRLIFSAAIILGTTLITGCRGRQANPDLEKPTVEATGIIIPTATLLPTATQAPTATATIAAPTSIPAPTEIAVTGQPTIDLNLNINIASGPGIYLSEELGEPGETLLVEGQGFEPSTKVTFHWSKVDGPLGPKVSEIITDENGEFSTSIQVPAAANWPGGSAQPNDFIQLRAKHDSWAATEYFWANFRYVERFSPGTSLVLLYENETFGYSIALPNGWAWEWTDDDVSNVRFTGPSGGSGFARVISGSAGTVIPQVMGLEASGQTFASATGAIGAYPATRVTATNGLVVLFTESGGKTYAVSFKDSAGNAFNLILNSFRFR